MKDIEIAHWLSAAPHLYARKSIAYDDNSDFLEFLVKEGLFTRGVSDAEIRFSLTREGAAWLSNYRARPTAKTVQESCADIAMTLEELRKLIAQAVHHRHGGCDGCKDEMRDTIQALTISLAGVEWRIANACPSCGSTKTMGHRADCPIGLSLRVGYEY